MLFSSTIILAVLALNCTARDYMHQSGSQFSQSYSQWGGNCNICLESGEEPVYRVYVLGVIEKEDRKAHLPVAAKETFKYAVIRQDKKDKIMQELGMHLMLESS